MKGVTADSREVKPGYTFVAIKGTQLNGEEYVDSAIAKGATRIIVSEDSQIELDGVEIVKVANPREHLSKLAAEFYSKQPENIVAITGTNGKTSTAYFYKQICTHAGNKSASIGTLGIYADGMKFNNKDTLTSPDPVKLHSVLSDLKDNDINHVAIEASSHGLKQHRLDGIKFKAAAFTNFSRDHLDYHPTEKDYFDSKSRLFTDLLAGPAILNADIPEYKKLKELCEVKGLRVLSYGQNGDYVKLISNNDLEIAGERYWFMNNLAGDFQIYNVMAAAALAISTGIAVQDVVSSIEGLKAAPGRLEEVGEFNQGKIFVDYAHTPDALETALKSLKHECIGKLHVLFGCGGDRDAGKRPQMGKVAADFADIVIVTDDNPRTEDPAKIRKQTLDGCPDAIEVADRGVAIKTAIEALKPNDMLLIAGKGHEDYQIIGTEKIHFSDHEEVKKVINN